MRRFVVLAAFLAAPCLALAADREVAPVPGALAQAISTAEAGQVLRLGPGRHTGGLTLSNPIVLECAQGAQIVGTGVGSVLKVTGPDVTVRGCQISGSGSSHETIDSGVQLTKTADRAKVIGNRIAGNLYGVDIHGARDALVADNVILGRQDRHMNARGNGVYVWNAPGAKVIGNDIRWGRDGIFVNTSRNNEFSKNRFRDLRFAVHYMHAHDSVVAENISIGNHLGYAVMYSDRVEVRDNVSENDRDHGVMLNYTNSSVITGNRVTGGPEKCIFVYNAHKNRIEGNWLQNCTFGIHFTAGSERNEISGNTFAANQTQVKYAGTKWVNFSANGRGNYWSDFPAYDLNGDGIAEGQFRPNDAMDRVLWTQPAARLLLGSPAVQLVRWSQSAFPALLPGGVVDSAPLMQPVEPNSPEWEPKHD